MLRFLKRGKNKQTVNHTPNAARYCQISGSVVSDIGSVRTNNEDNYILGQYINQASSGHSEMTASFLETDGKWLLAGVFDGIGGGEVGELASHDTAEIFLSASQQIADVQSKAEVDFSVRSVFLEANNRIIALRKDYRIGGTTGTVLCTNGSDAKIYHLGDSRAYLIRGDAFFQLTKDQTLAQLKLQSGLYSEDDPRIEADKHKLLDYIGRDSTMNSLQPQESRWFSAKPGDHILLCSDGLYDMCSDKEIAEIFRCESSIGDKAVQLVQTSISHGGEDNITCVVVVFAE